MEVVRSLTAIVARAMVIIGVYRMTVVRWPKVGLSCNLDGKMACAAASDELTLPFSGSRFDIGVTFCPIIRSAIRSTP